MGTLVSEQVDIGVNVLEQSVTATSNWVFQLGLHLLKLRKLPPTYLVDKRKLIEDSLFAWLAEQSLQGVSFEVYDPESGRAIERFDFEFTYRAEADTTVSNPNMAKVSEFCEMLPALPSGAVYRLVVSTAPGATQLEGWDEGEFLPLDIERELGLSDHGFGTIGTQFIYRGGLI